MSKPTIVDVESRLLEDRLNEMQNAVHITVVPDEEPWRDDFPADIRFAEYPNGERRLQGCYVYHQDDDMTFRWEDIPLVKVDEAGEAIDE